MYLCRLPPEQEDEVALARIELLHYGIREGLPPPAAVAVGRTTTHLHNHIPFTECYDQRRLWHTMRLAGLIVARHLRMNGGRINTQGCSRNELWTVGMCVRQCVAVDLP